MKTIKTKKYAAMEEKGEKYEDIIFLQESNADEALDILERDGPEGALDYLTQWHFPGEHDVREGLGAGADDYTHENDGYVMNWNLRIPYIGLKYRVFGSTTHP